MLTVKQAVINWNEHTHTHAKQKYISANTQVSSLAQVVFVPMFSRVCLEDTRLYNSQRVLWYHLVALLFVRFVRCFLNRPQGGWRNKKHYSTTRRLGCMSTHQCWPRAHAKDRTTKRLRARIHRQQYTQSRGRRETMKGRWRCTPKGPQ